MNVLTITDRAAEHMNSLMENAPEGTIGLRVSIKKGGCSGYEYNVDYAHDTLPLEECIRVNDDIKVIIPPASIMFLLGSVMDYQQKTFSEGFAFTNPNETGRCGCGESIVF